MKIVLLTPFFRPDNYGGAVQVYENLCRDQDYEVHVICSKSKSVMDDDTYYKETGIKIHRVNDITFEFSSAFKMVRVFEFVSYLVTRKREIIKLIDRIEPDVVINGGVRWLSWLTKKIMKNYKVLNYIHGEELSMIPRGVIAKWFFKEQNNGISIADLNICVSSYTVGKVKEIAVDANVKVLTNFVDIKKYTPAKCLTEVKTKHDLCNKVSLITVCRLIKRKGIDDLLVALAELIGEDFGTHIVLNVCGAGPELNILKTQAKSLGLENNVFFHGFTEDQVMLEMLQASDIFVMPNKTVDGDLEGFGLVFLEANACGLPVIGGSSGGVVDAISDNNSGILVEPGKKSELKDAIRLLILDEDVRHKFGRFGKERAISEFSLEKKRLQFNSVLRNYV